MSALGGESPRGREYAPSPLAPLPTNTGEGDARGDLGQRSLSQTRGWERMSALVGGESTREGGWSMASVTDSRTGTDVRFGWGRVHAGGRLVNGAGIWSMDSIADSRTRTDVRFGRGESTREGGWSMVRGVGQRTLSQTRGRERMSALGGESPRGREAGQWRGDLVNGLCHGLAGGNECPFWVGENSIFRFDFL
jgi:hypothetical protein